VEVKQLAAAAMVESVSTEDRQIVLNFNSSREIKKLSLAQDFKLGIKAGSRHIKLDIKLLGNDWQEVLREVLQKVATDVQS